MLLTNDSTSDYLFSKVGENLKDDEHLFFLVLKVLGDFSEKVNWTSI